MYKLSQYLVPVGINEQNEEKTLVYSTRTNSLKLIDRKFWKKLEQNDLGLLKPEMIQDLLDNKIIISTEENELQTILNENKESIHHSDHLYLSIQPTAACPLGCGYCGQKHENKNMRLDIQDALINRLQRKLKQKTYKSLSITWFGAEPLSGFSVIRALAPRIISLSRDYSLRYQSKIVTNGFLLEHHIAQELSTLYYINEYEITLDGTDFFHDQRRHTKAMGPSFDRIYNNLKLLSTLTEADIVIRCNVDRRNKDGVVALLKLLRQDKLHRRIKFYVAPIHSWGNDAHLIAAEKTQFAQWEIEWLIEMECLDYKVSYLPQRTKAVCFAVKPEHELIDPYGEVYGCSEVSLVPSYVKNGENIHKLGSVFEDELSHKNRRQYFENFYDESTLNKFDCISCRMLPTCGGGCPKEWAEGRIPCPSTKFNIEERLLLAFVKNRYTDVFQNQL